MSILRFDNVSYQYPGESFDIIDRLSFSVEPGSFHCIVGVSGCGKSTIFRLINGLLPPKAGTISVNGKPITAREHYCGYMPQRDLLFPWRTVAGNLCLPMEIRGGISREGEAVMAPVRAYVGKYGYARGSAKQPRIVAASLAGDAGIIGAALLGTEKK